MHVDHDETDLRLQVTRHDRVADDIVVLELRHPAGAELPAWAPGAHIDLETVPGLIRQYSLCGDPADRGAWRIAVLREPESRGGSRFVHDELTTGSLVAVRGPRNNFALVAAPRYVFVAGGIGITPIMPMAAAAAATGADWQLHYGGRSLSSMAFRHELATAHGDRVRFHPQDTEGLLDLGAILRAADAGTLVYCCGPEPLLRAVEERCADLHIGALHVERFSPKDLDEPILTGSFEVELARSGITLQVPPESSILEVAAEAGVAVQSSCQEGTCGTCETPVLSGQVDHRDSLLTPDEQALNDTMFICVSRAACPRLLLDL
jgi:ferredoxin-NADP reductase